MKGDDPGRGAPNNCWDIQILWMHRPLLPLSWSW
jgi:hypothetical protein